MPLPAVVLPKPPEAITDPFLTPFCAVEDDIAGCRVVVDVVKAQTPPLLLMAAAAAKSCRATILYFILDDTFVPPPRYFISSPSK
mmetsp:Transcript_8337/g.14114  ORF Transcript_8337/g.14114 Transcript_8337/m.14114 type:complete len:85 (+) Transcript_8337:1027-1281(+)